MSTASKHRQPVIGVIGGMGPDATVDLMRRVIEATPASDDIDHIRMIVDNNPKIPSRMQALIDRAGEDPAPVLAAMARGLETAGADVLVIPCNTAHHYLPAIRAAVHVPVVDMIALSVARLRVMLGAGPRIGLLASPAIRLTGQFERCCDAAGIEIVHPAGADEAAVLAIIRAVKANAVNEDTTVGVSCGGKRAGDARRGLPRRRLHGIVGPRRARPQSVEQSRRAGARYPRRARRRHPGAVWRDDASLRRARLRLE